MYEFIFAIFLFGINGILMLKPYGWINLFLGIFTLGIGALTINDTANFPFQPYFSLLLLFAAAICMYQGADSLRR